MKPRLIFLSLICALLFTWYQLLIVPYGPSANKMHAEKTRDTHLIDSTQHPITQSSPEVW